MELKELTNNQKRKEWLESYRGWLVWFTKTGLFLIGILINLIAKS